MNLLLRKLLSGAELAAGDEKKIEQLRERARWTDGQSGIYVQLAENQGSFATGQVYGAAGGSGQP